MTTHTLSSPCSIKNCDRGGQLRRGLCGMHDRRRRIYGSPGEATVRANFGKGDTEESRFWSRVGGRNANGCREWLGGTSGGYGRACVAGKIQRANRIVWFYTFGVWPTLLILHSCDNPRCCEITHLREGTNQDNTDDKVSRNRQVKGEAHIHAKLTEEQVVEIRCRYAAKGISQSQLAEIFNVSQTAIAHIVRRKNWRHV